MDQKNKKGYKTKRLLVLLLSCAVALTGLTACKDKQKSNTAPKSTTEIQQQDDNSQTSQQSTTDQTQSDDSISQSDSQVQSGTQTDKPESATTQNMAGNDKSKVNNQADSGSQKSTQTDKQKEGSKQKTNKK